jgi:hypothetical protein
VLQANDGVAPIAKMARRSIFALRRFKPMCKAEIKTVLGPEEGLGRAKIARLFC